MIPLVVGALLASLALAFVLYPLFDDDAGAAAATGPRAPRTPALAVPSAVDALREIEFDRATGKLSETDYEALKATYTRQAIAEMRADRAAPAAADASAESDPIEALIRAQRERLLTCPTCGPRPEPDAVFCSSCGRYLAHDCARCGAEIREGDARFCSSCGYSLAA